MKRTLKGWLVDNHLTVDNPTQLIILLPPNLPDGDYTLTVTTQYSSSEALLKKPRSASKVITIGQSPETPSTGPADPPNGGTYIDPNA